VTATYLRKRSRARSSGAVVELFDTAQPENVFDPDGGRWVTICEHGSLVNHRSLTTARDFMSAPECWCEVCEVLAAPVT
jgi:hypothetical protein